MCGLSFSAFAAPAPATTGAATPAAAAPKVEGGTGIFACGTSGTDECITKDKDGWFVNDPESTQVDCNDNDSTVYPGAPLIIGDGVNNACVDGADDVSELEELVAKVGGPTSKKGIALIEDVRYCMNGGDYALGAESDELGVFLWAPSKGGVYRCVAPKKSDIQVIGKSVTTRADREALRLASSASANASEAKASVETLRLDLDDKLKAAQDATSKEVKKLLEEQAKKIEARIVAVEAEQATQKTKLERIDGSDSKQNGRLDRLERTGFSLYGLGGLGGEFGPAILADVCQEFNEAGECLDTEVRTIRYPGAGVYGLGGGVAYNTLGGRLAVEAMLSLTTAKGDDASGAPTRYGGRDVEALIAYTDRVRDSAWFAGGYVSGGHRETGSTPSASRTATNFGDIGAMLRYEVFVKGPVEVAGQCRVGAGWQRYATAVVYGGDFLQQGIVGSGFEGSAVCGLTVGLGPVGR